ncbi:MAG TPA: alpha/beta hydrolase [Arenimonas sp.]|uniref:alpha/beta hydrolase n=1 Tax=Arenimonas sp. TaxID=1872635 RepID=UPI002B53CC59|nr:alpha/beta hydrolase [Arenimonas sp.]HMB58075.1 alpha/beta hydrolase [Arenimonas sp.]
MKKYSRWIVMLIAFAVIAWTKWHPGHTDTADKANAAAAAVEKPVARRLGQLEFTPCTLAPEFATQALEAQCTTLQVPENHAAPNGRKISLAIAWLPAKGDAEPDPMFMIAGGPGQSALESFPGIAPAFAELRKKRNVILVDQRGTGGSNKLVCKNVAGKNAVMEDNDDSVADAQAFAKRCAAELSKKADLRFYSTTDAIQDLDDVRAAIGADKVNLMGVSYGTRVAQQYGKRYPQHTRTITIDGIAPNSLVLGNDFSKNLEASLDLQFARCKQDKLCAAKLGDPRARLNALMKQLAVAPPLVHYRDAVTGEAREEKLTPGHVANLARMFAYAPQVAGLLPLELNEAAQGRYEPLMALSKLITSTVGDQIMTGMQLSVVCTEDASELKADPADAGSLIGEEMVTVTAAQCAVWPKGRRPAGFREPLTGNVPVLIMSGEFDPVTPPRYGEEVHSHLPNSRHLIVRGQGHNVLPAGCMPRLFAQFVDSADAMKLDASCLDKVPYAQPFTGFYGWEP